MTVFTRLMSLNISHCQHGSRQKMMALGLFGATASFCLVVFVFALDIMGVFSRKNHFDVEGKVGKLLYSQSDET